jgi:hypothetical protein
MSGKARSDLIRARRHVLGRATWHLIYGPRKAGFECIGFGRKGERWEFMTDVFVLLALWGRFESLKFGLIGRKMKLGSFLNIKIESWKRENKFHCERSSCESFHQQTKESFGVFFSRYKFNSFVRKTPYNHFHNELFVLFKKCANLDLIFCLHLLSNS